MTNLNKIYDRVYKGMIFGFTIEMVCFGILIGMRIALSNK